MSDKPSLLSLPVEIRLHVYSCLDHDESPIEYPLSEPYSSQASYLLTCRQLRYEIQHDFFSNNVFAIGFNPDMQMASTKHTTFEAGDAKTGSSLEDLQLPMFHVQRTARLFDIPTLEHGGKQEPTDLWPFHRFSALGDDLKMIKNLQLHMLHWRLGATQPRAFYDMLPAYVDKCKEHLNVVLEALVVLQKMKEPLGLTKLTVVDKVPYRIRGWGCTTGRLRTMANIKAMFLNAYWPLLTQAAATLGISIENVKVDYKTFRGAIVE